MTAARDGEGAVARHRAGAGPAAVAPGRRDRDELLADELAATSPAIAAAGRAVLLLAVTPQRLPADGGSTATVTVTLGAVAGTPAPGRHVTVDTDDPGQAVGDVIDHGDGTYTATLRASDQPGHVVVRAQEPAAGLLATVTIEQVADSVPAAAAAVAVAAASASGVPIAAATAAAAGILASWDRFAADRLDEQAADVDAVLVAQPGGLPADVRDELIDREVSYERAWAAKARARLDRDLPRALAIADPAERERAVQRILDRERRYLEMRDAAVLARAESAADSYRVIRASPEGVYWQLDETLNTHTADCVAAEGKVWPPSALDAFGFKPRRHPNCGCRLRTAAWARARGLWRRDNILTVDQAMREIPRILALEEAARDAGALDDALSLLEAEWDPLKHPRDRRGRWRRRPFRRAEIDPRLWSQSRGALRFDSVSDANEWGWDAYEDWWEQLDDDEQEAVRYYKGSWYRRINEILRGTTDAEPEPHEVQWIEALDRALLLARLPEPQVVAWRGFTSEQLLNKFHRLQPGDLLDNDGGYVSTSLLRNVATGFSYRGGEPIIAEVHLAEGANAAYLDLPGLDMNEAEMLLPRWTVFRVRWAGERTDGHRHLILDAETGLDEGGAS